MEKLFAIAAILFTILFTSSQIISRTPELTAPGTGGVIDDSQSNREQNSLTADNKTAYPSPGSINARTSYTSTDTVQPVLKTYSKFDFIPGDKVLAVDDFSQDNVGDFPAKWNTNSSGEVVTASDQQGHWLMVRKQGKFIPVYIKTLPDNFTFEYDVVCNEKFNFYSPALLLYFLTGKNGKEVFDFSFIPWEKRSGVKIGVHPANVASNGGTAIAESFENGTSIVKNEVNTTQFNSNAGKTKLHVSVWRQQQRVRVYLNEEKIYDLPRALPANKTYTATLFELWGNMNNDADRYLISNIKFSSGAPDTRNKLITGGKFVTNGILFDVNSAVIKPQSYGVLKDIAGALKENADVKTKIIGHTDSDGDEAKNIDLSRRRAEAVKDVLAQEFGIDQSRMQTDGKGESEPVDKNDTPEGKANNRRVEFRKL